MWVRFKRFGRWEKFWLAVEKAALLACRERVAVEYRRHVEKHGKLGFVPRTFAASVADEVGLERGSGADSILVSYALYQRVQVEDGGSWQDGPRGRWRTLASVYEEGTA